MLFAGLESARIVKNCDLGLENAELGLTIQYICRPWSVRIGKNCALGLEYGPRPAALDRTQDLGHSFSQYGPTKDGK